MRFDWPHKLREYRVRGTLMVVGLICGLSLSSCMFWKLKRDLTRWEGMAFNGGKDAKLGFNAPPLAMVQGKRGLGAFPNLHVGEIVKADDPRFTIENGKMGLWEPVDFLFKVGAGIYFLEPYDRQKMPVLFIHGAGGNPSEWKYLIEHLDQKKFQPWLVYYPSGLRIEETARSIARWTQMLAARYGACRIVMIAHSMGGLVARAAINRSAAEGGGKNLAAFVSISTPWGGNATAESGVNHAPVVMPLWNDIVPGSPFLDGLFRKPLPDHCPFYLLFSYNGQSHFLDEPNDGAVAISSELSQDAQQVATRIFGFKENHRSILQSQEVSRTLNGILDEALRMDEKEKR